MASARTVVAAVSPLIADAVAARREVLRLAIDAAPARPTVDEMNEVWLQMVERPDVDELSQGLRQVADLLAQMDLLPPSSLNPTGASDPFVTQ